MKGRTPTLDEACSGGGGGRGGGAKIAGVARPTLEEFRHLTAVVASYAFHLPDDEGTDRTVMLPLLDLVNHANAGVANAVVAREGEDFTVRALRDINEGEEVSFFFFSSRKREEKKKKREKGEKMPLFSKVLSGLSPASASFMASIRRVSTSRFDRDRQIVLERRSWVQNVCFESGVSTPRFVVGRADVASQTPKIRFSITSFQLLPPISVNS